MEEKKQPPSRKEIDVTLEALGLRRFSTEEKSVLTSLGAKEISFVESRFSCGMRLQSVISNAEIRCYSKHIPKMCL